MPDHAANYKRQKKGFELLSERIRGFYVPNKAEKKKLLDLMGVSKRFQQTFDAIRLRVDSFDAIKAGSDFDLLEVKTTDKCLPELPKGFFFGMTENEEALLKVFEGRYFLCLVCLHKSCPNYVLISWKELQPLIRNRRIQFQINLVPRARAAKA